MTYNVRKKNELNEMMTHSDTLTSVFEIGEFTSNDDAITFGLAGDAISVGKVNSRPSFFHQAVDVLPGSANHVRMERIAHLHGQSYRWSLNKLKKNEMIERKLHYIQKSVRLTARGVEESD